MNVALIAHGGAGDWRPGSERDALEGVTAAVEAGRAILRAGGTALDLERGVHSSICFLERGDAGLGAQMGEEGAGVGARCGD